MALKLSHILGNWLLLLVIEPLAVESRALQSAADSSTIFQNLEGCHKGQTVKGLQQLKRYLHAFGYLNYNDPQNTNLTDDQFDDAVESALKRYQKNYHLNVTGILDPATINEMMIKRCGNPDIINHIPTKEKSSQLHTVAHYEFFDQSKPRWPLNRTRLFYIFRGGVQVVSLEELRPIVKRAFQRWADVSHFTFEEVTAGAPQIDIEIGFHSFDHGDKKSFDGFGRVLAHAFPPPYGRFHFDASENWTTTTPSIGQTDLESVAVHEIGHLLGLGHSSDPKAIMFPEYPTGAVKRELGQDDIDGIRALYAN